MCHPLQQCTLCTTTTMHHVWCVRKCACVCVCVCVCIDLCIKYDVHLITMYNAYMYTHTYMYMCTWYQDGSFSMQAHDTVLIHSDMDCFTPQNYPTCAHAYVCLFVWHACTRRAQLAARSRNNVARTQTLLFTACLTRGRSRALRTNQMGRPPHNYPWKKAS